MRISNTTLEAIQEAARSIEARVDYSFLNSKGTRFRVKLYPSHHKPIRVPGSDRRVYRVNKATRARLRVALNELMEHTSVSRVHDSIIHYASEPTIMQIEKLTKLIEGEMRPTWKRVARYAREAPSGKKALNAVCWHGFRDFFIKLFSITPDAYVRTGIAVYRGVEHFNLNYPQTAYKNIGSHFSPMMFEDACFCSR